MNIRCTHLAPSRTTRRLLAALAVGVLVGTAAGQPAGPLATRPATRPTTRAALAGRADRPPAEWPPPVPMGSTGLVARMLSSVLIVLLVGAVGLVVVKRFLPRIAANGAGRKLAAVDCLHLGARKTVHLLQVGSRRYLVASSREAISAPVDVTDAFAEDGAGVSRYERVAREVGP